MSEEDIKILEELILYYEAEAISRKFIGNLSISVNEDDIQAIENLLKGYREKEEIIEKLNKNTLDFSNTVIKDFIPKSKVKEKIEELGFKTFGLGNQPELWEIKEQIKLLQELMEE